MMHAVSKTDYDSPWKGMIERYFREFIAFFFPDAHTEIDWARGYSFMDKELRQVTRDAGLGRRMADKLVKVHHLNGSPAGLLIHIEVQDQVDEDFPKRMYVYNYRLFDRYGLKTASFAILGDPRKDWRPASYGYELWGCRSRLDFPAVKLLDYEKRYEELMQNRNPFSVFVIAHLKTLSTRGNPGERQRWKIHVVKMLYERGYSRQDVLDMFHVIDWLMALPEEMEEEFVETMVEYEREKKMPYINSAERLGMRKGREEGIQKGRQEGIQKGATQRAREDLIDVLEARFGQVPPATSQDLLEISSSSQLKHLLIKAVQVESIEQFQQEMARIQVSPS